VFNKKIICFHKVEDEVIFLIKKSFSEDLELMIKINMRGYKGGTRDFFFREL